MNLLLPVDGSNHANQAVHHAIKLRERGLNADLHLINVQPGLSGNIVLHLDQQLIEQYHRDQSDKALASACALLDLAGIDYQTHRAVGDIAGKIADCVSRCDIEQIIMGSRGMDAIGNLLLGSVATKVIHRVSVPVTLVSGDA
jgi:nucleotide-binding universal stress UspA family protein